MLGSFFQAQNNSTSSTQKHAIVKLFRLLWVKNNILTKVFIILIHINPIRIKLGSFHWDCINIFQYSFFEPVCIITYENSVLDLFQQNNEAPIYLFILLELLVVISIWMFWLPFLLCCLLWVVTCKSFFSSCTKEDYTWFHCRINSYPFPVSNRNTCTGYLVATIKNM